jgi:hypothetical protein
MPSHDLDAILLDVLKLFAPLPHRIDIRWVDLDDTDTELFDEIRDWACCHGTKAGLFIGIHPTLKRAPRYVLKYIIAHEVLHLAIPPHNGVAHTKAFYVAERLLPGYHKAIAWLGEKTHPAPKTES